ncbi:MAG: hypothetical protein A2X94_08865 [Bdellovibrionales bacterium GWB1_55_8]|nr:MAG: hypothetical protein A2X94_08865 [Bdellovibrionales bacterium GWB1_55_8]
MSLLRRISFLLLLTGTGLPPALAKDVSIEWQEIPGASEYEFEIQATRASKAKEYRLDSPKWNGDLPYGVYSYRIRALDRRKRAGIWSDPQPVAVMPPAPTPQKPEDGTRLKLYHPKATTTLSWMPVKGAKEYQIEVFRAGKPHLDQMVKTSSVDLGALPPGSYTWKVRAVLKPPKRAPANFDGRSWISDPSDESEFRIERAYLERPVLLGPMGILPPPMGGELTFVWKTVEGADKYELRIVRTPGLANPAAFSGALSKAKPSIITAKDGEESVKLHLPEGSYVWQVRALASLSTTESHAGPENRSSFELNPNAVFARGAGYVALSTMLAPYSYEIISPSANRRGATSSTAMTIRGSGDYWPWPQWGIGAAAELTSFSLNRENFNRFTGELMAKYQSSISRDRFGWFLAPKLGIEARQYLSVLPERAAETLLAMGASAGIDIRKQLSEKWSVSGKFAYFMPLSLSGNAESITGDASYRNASLGIQGQYWLNKNIGLSAGMYAEKRSISYLPPGTTAAEQLFMDGTYFFGSIIYSFTK